MLHKWKQTTLALRAFFCISPPVPVCRSSNKHFSLDLLKMVGITLYRPMEKKYTSIGWRIRLLLEEKKLKYETRLVVLTQKENEQEDILQMNPRGELPIMTDVDAILHEEGAMLLYIENYYPDPPLIGQPTQENRKDYAQNLVLFNESIGVWATFCKSILTYLMNEKIDKKVLKEKVKEWRSSADMELLRWEKLLASNNSEFLGGKTVMMVDIAFFPYLAHLVRYGLELNSYPRLKAYYNIMEKRPSVVKTWPSGWSTTAVEKYLSDKKK
jgi:glutathione S-transferase